MNDLTNIQFLDLKAAYSELSDEIEEAIKRVLDSGRYILGPEVDSFEQEYATFCKAEYAVGVGSGLDALFLALLAMDTGSGDEVIVPSNTYIATWLAVSQCGATPVPVEPDMFTYNIDPDKIKSVITPHTKVIIPVHLYGQPVDLDPILNIANEHGLYVLEDAAQAHGARYKGKRIGSHGDVVAWSFYPGKNLGAIGDGGAITTNNQKIADRVRVLRNYGSRVKYLNEVQGYNSRLDPIQAAILNVKLKYLDKWNSRRKQIALTYLKELKNIDITLPKIANYADPVWHLFVIRSNERESLQRHLYKSNINTLIHYPIPPYLQKAYIHLGYSSGSYPGSELLANEVISLPIGPHLKKDEIKIIIKSIQDFYK